MDTPKPRILIVDDSSSSRHGVRRVLEDMSLEVVEAKNGKEGLEKALSEPFDLVVTDINMPVMDGYQLCERLKKTDATKSLPVVILSTQDNDEDIEAGFCVGASAYVPKAKFADLAHTVSILLEKHFFLKDRLVLVVDDSASIRTLLANDIRREGFQVLTASDGLEAMEVLEKGTRPDIVVTDLEMPRMGGIQLIAEIVHDERFSDIPVVVMSTHSDRSAIFTAMHAGAVSYISKPFRAEQLAILLERLLSDHFRLLMAERRRLETKQKLFLASMTSLINALEARDRYTRGHSDSVARYSVRIGRAMGFSSLELDRLKLAAQLHDIGKIGVRDDALLKPGRLTPEEYDHIKQHPAIAVEILSPIPGLEDAIDAAGSHHERWNGQGYPRQLAGQDIPPLARIIAVADVFDALTSDRPYRKGMDRGRALEIIREGRGKDFCPVCTDAFLRCIEEEDGAEQARDAREGQAATPRS